MASHEVISVRHLRLQNEGTTMGLACKFLGHTWNKLPDGGDGCTCSRCGEHRNEGHDWRFAREREDWTYGGPPEIIRGCFNVCTVCGRWETAPDPRDVCEHDWRGCTCALCGKVRDEGHDWDRPKPQGDGKNHRCQCRICGKYQLEPHTFKQLSGCRRRCTACNYVDGAHDFRDGVCAVCGADESEYFCELILSGKAAYDERERDPADGSRMEAIDHVKSVGALRRIALASQPGIDVYCRMSCANKLADIARAGGADAHEANLTLRELVLGTSLGWNKPMVAGWITEPAIAADPDLVEAVRRANQSQASYDNAMIAADSGLGRSG